MVLRRLFLLGLFAVFASAASCAPHAAKAGAKTEKLTIATTDRGDAHFQVEIADSDEERRIGLMYRTSLPENGGMLFDFSDEDRVQSMWMKNTLIPLDMAFVAKDGRIVRIEAMTTPRSPGCAPALTPPSMWQARSTRPIARPSTVPMSPARRRC